MLEWYLSGNLTQLDESFFFLDININNKLNVQSLVKHKNRIIHCLNCSNAYTKWTISLNELLISLETTQQLRFLLSRHILISIFKCVLAFDIQLSPFQTQTSFVRRRRFIFIIPTNPASFKCLFFFPLASWNWVLFESKPNHNDRKLRAAKRAVCYNWILVYD